MLNYIWGGLIVVSLIFAISYDIKDFASDTYRNGASLPLELTFLEGYVPEARRQSVQVHLDAETYQTFYNTDEVPAETYVGTLLQTAEGRQIHFARDMAVPAPLGTIRSMTSPRDNDVRGTLDIARVQPGTLAVGATITFNPVRWVKMNAIAAAALDFAETAVTIALGLIGALALWMGLLKIAEASGILYVLVRITQPVLRSFFPEVPRDHPALGMIALNLTANMLGLGNAATPLGIKAMQELQTLNPSEDTATNSMVMLLAMNTASVQIVPPVLLVAIMGLHVNQLFFSILITTGLSLMVAILAAKGLGRMKRYRKSNPSNT